MISSQQRQCHDQLQALLETQVSGLQALNSYLEQVKAAIGDNDIERLNQLLTGSKVPGDELLKFEKAREELLTGFQFTSDSAGLMQCLQWCDEEGLLTDLHQTFQQSLTDLQRSIQVNSLLVNKGQDRIRRSLGLLTGQVSKENTRTYQSNGKAELEASLRSIAHA